MAESVRSRLNTQKTNCHWIQTSQRYSLRSNGSRTGPACCSRVPPPDVLTMLRRSSRTTSAARDGVLLRILAAVRLPGRHAPKWIRSVESAMPSRSMTNVANLQPRMVSAASDGAHLQAHLSDPAQRRRYPDRRPAKAASSHPNLDNAAVRRSAYGEPAPGEQQSREKATLS